MIKIVLSNDLHDHFKRNKESKILVSNSFNFQKKEDQDYYQRILKNFKKQIFYLKPFTISGKNYSEVFFDFEQMIYEFSIRSGINEVNNMEILNDFKQTHEKKVSTIEELIDKSFKEIEEKFESSNTNDFNLFVKDIKNNQVKSFMIGCIPNVSNGNYVNIPIKYINIINDIRHNFLDEEDFFIHYIDKMPIKINIVNIDDIAFLNITNLSIVPIFLNMNTEYFIKSL